MFRYLITLAYIFPVKELHVNFSVQLIMRQLFSMFMYELISFLCQKIWVLFPKVLLVMMHIAKGMRQGNSTNEFLQLFCSSLLEYFHS